MEQNLQGTSRLLLARRLAPVLLAIACVWGAALAAASLPPDRPGLNPTAPLGAGASQHGQEPGATATSGHGAESPEAAHEGEPLWKTGARFLNFAILAGTLVYLLRSPLSTFLAQRGVAVRRDLTSAAEMKRASAAQLADIERKVAALPGELEALRAQAARDIAAERARIREASEAERLRLAEVARRRIEMAVRIAERDLARQAADLIVDRAAERIRRSITPEDQARLIDRYLARVPTAAQRDGPAPGAGRAAGESSR